MEAVRAFRKQHNDSYNSTAAVHPTGIPTAVRSHARVDGALQLHRDQPMHDLRPICAARFPGIVTGNVKNMA